MRVEERSGVRARPQFDNIQYLRAVAALMVVFHHARNPLAGGFNPLLGYTIGEAGVDIFFVISGFIMLTIGVKEQVGTFISRRLVRIYPLYWIACFLTLFVLIASKKENLFVGHVIKSFLLIPYYNPIHGGEIWPILVPGWTLSYELFFYGIFAIGLVAKKPLIVPLFLLLATVAAGAIFPFRGLSPCCLPIRSYWNLEQVFF
ncbi:acyltransferase [Sphingomonas sp. LR60]|uniref:acyltransferase family protein n=1 Tax=Sphingomonas sp. LR60 TaxID=3050233 RepID=UPI002FE08F67